MKVLCLLAMRTMLRSLLPPLLALMALADAASILTLPNGSRMAGFHKYRQDNNFHKTSVLKS